MPVSKKRRRAKSTDRYHYPSFVGLRAEGNGLVLSANDTHSHCCGEQACDSTRSDGLIAASRDKFWTW
jgi:hypothetical protein